MSRIFLLHRNQGAGVPVEANTGVKVQVICDFVRIPFRIRNVPDLGAALHIARQGDDPVALGSHSLGKMPFQVREPKRRDIPPSAGMASKLAETPTRYVKTL